MHKLLQQVGRQAIQRQEPWKRQILIDPQEIWDVLERAEGTRAVSGISFDISDIEEVSISHRGFRRMPNLRFLKVYKSKDDKNEIVHIPKEMELPCRLRLLHWEAYPSKCLPRTFNLEYLVELNLPKNKLEKLWAGTQPLANLKKMHLRWSFNLKELPDLSKAANLEELVLHDCSSLLEIPPYIGNLDKLGWLDMSFCRKLQEVPTLFKLAPGAFVDLRRCSRIRKFPDISTNTTALVIEDTMLEKLPKSASVSLWQGLQTLSIFAYGDGAGIQKLPDWIKNLHGLKSLNLQNCWKLASLPELPGTLERLITYGCESLKVVSLDYYSIIDCSFPNCFKLCLEARRAITQLAWKACLPGRTIPSEFDHRALGNSLTIQSLSSDSGSFRVCIVVSPRQQILYPELSCRMRLNKGCPTKRGYYRFNLLNIQEEHLCIFYSDLVDAHGWLEQENEVMFEFITCEEMDIIECGVQVLTDEAERRRRIEFDPASQHSSLNTELRDRLICDSNEDNKGKTENRTYCWSWLIPLFDFSDFVRSLFWGQRR